MKSHFKCSLFVFLLRIYSKMDNLIFLIALAIGTVYGDPLTKLVVYGVDIKITPNPYAANWEATLAPSHDAVSLKMPILKDVPPEMTLKMEVKLGDDDYGGSEMTLCEAMENQFIGRDITAAGTPKGKFPTECPMKAGVDYAVNNFVFPREKIPPILPDGLFNGTITVFEDGKDPFIFITFDGELSHEIPHEITHKIAGFGR